MLVVSGRAMEGLRKYFGVSFHPVVTYHTRVEELIILNAHSVDHQGGDTTLDTATQVAWIAGDRILAGKIVDLCVRCRFLNKKFYSDGGRLLF